MNGLRPHIEMAHITLFKEEEYEERKKKKIVEITPFRLIVPTFVDFINRKTSFQLRFRIQFFTNIFCSLSS